VQEPYSNDELEGVDPDSWPARGETCARCKATVPRFGALGSSERDRLVQMADGGNSARAMAELQRLTGCPARWAKIWVVHRGVATPTFSGPPCPHCGKRIRTPQAKQCAHCHADWH